MRLNLLDPSPKFKNTTPQTTNIKSNYSNSSPKDILGQWIKLPNQDNTNINKKLNFKDEPLSSLREAKDIMRQSQRRVSTITMADLFKQNVQNRDFRDSSYTKIFNSAIHTQELQLLHNQHRVEIQKLLLQISRLHDVIYQIERVKKYQLQRLKQQYEQMTYLHLSNMKQSQISQLQILEIQLKKTKDALDEKTLQFEQIQRSTNKQRQLLKNENQTLRNNLKQLVTKKNQQLFEIQAQNQQKLKRANRMSNDAVQEMKQACDRQIRRIQRQMKQKQQLSQKMKLNFNETNEKNNNLQQKIQLQRIQLQEKLQIYIKQSNNRYEKLMDHVNHLFQQQVQHQGEKQRMFKQLYQCELKNLMNLIKLKGQENNRIKTQLQTQRLQFKLLKQNSDQQNNYLRELIRTIQKRNLQQIEQLKVRMALLHQNDLKELVKLYQTKIQCLNQELIRQSNQTERLRKYMHDQAHRWYQNKKNYEQQISKLSVQILRLRNGLGSMEKDMKQRLQNQRSAMLLTSKSLIRGFEMKNSNVKFYEDELRKLRITIEKKQNSSHQLQEQLREQILNLQQQIKRLIQSNKNNETQAHKIQQQYVKSIEDKDNQIKKLNKLALQLIDQRNINEGQQIKSLRKELEQLMKQLQDKSDKIIELNSRIQKLERDLQQCKIQNEQLYLQNQINHQQAKGQYQKIATSNMKSLKQFYERRIHQLEQDKKQLKNKQSAGQANIAELVRKYQMLQGCMRKMVKQAEKRTRLEERIINLGMDNNLVKNKTDLFMGQQ